MVTNLGLVAIHLVMATRADFVELYEREAEVVLVFFVRRTFDAEVALDLTAETFAQAWSGWARVRAENEDEVRGWLFTIARRQLGRWLRRGRVEQRGLGRLGVEVPEIDDADLAEIERAAQLDQLRKSVSASLSSLRKDQREALELRVIQELPYAEVAHRLNTTEPTARARVSRGLRALSAALDPALFPRGANR